MNLCGGGDTFIFEFTLFNKFAELVIFPEPSKFTELIKFPELARFPKVVGVPNAVDIPDFMEFAEKVEFICILGDSLVLGRKEGSNFFLN